MRLAVHSETLKDFFNTNCDPAIQRIVLSSKIAVTTSILNEYHAALNQNTNYLAWFSSSFSAGRFTTHAAGDAPKLVRDCDIASSGYGTPSYYAGSNLMAAAAHLAEEEIQALNAIGIALISPTGPVPPNLHGDNPFLTIAMQAGGTLSFDVLERFVKPEDDVIIYDKYINNVTVEVIEYIATLLSSTSTIQVIHSASRGAHLLSSAEIYRRIRLANSEINVSCKTCSTSFALSEHDRHIYLGNRIQITFTAGIDCFGAIDITNGLRKNKRSKLIFFDVTNGKNLSIELSDGTFCTVNEVGEL